MKQKVLRIMIIIEAFLLLIGIAGLFGKNAVYEFGPEDMQANFGSWSEQNGISVSAEAGGQRGNLADIGPISLPAGVYRVAMRYSTDTNMVNLCTVTDESGNYRTLQTNGGHMYAGRNSTDFVMWLYRDTDGLRVHAYYDGKGSLAVTGLTITETNALSRMWLFWVLVGSLAANVCYLYLQYEKQHPLSAKDKNVIFGLGIVILFASIPLMPDYMIGSGDLGYHLMRIEGIKDNLLAGNFPGRISPEWQQGYGYASPIFYGETLLYLPALLRLIGFSVLTSYRMFFFLVGVATVLVSYFCFWGIFREKYVGLFCSLLYTVSVYRIYKTYCCGSFGETFGILFLPLLAYGFFRVFAQDLEENNYSRSWIPLTVGFTGLIQSHLLSGEMAGFFTILLCMICVKKVFRKKTFLVLVKTVVCSVLLSAWFLVPFADYMLTGDFMIQHAAGRTIQERGVYLAHLLFTYTANGTSVFFANDGMANSAPMSPGAPVAALILWVSILFLRKTDKLSRAMLRLGQIAGAFAGLSLVMSLSAFPWDRIQRLHPVLAALVSSLQFPNRWISIATLMLTLTAGVVAVWVSANYADRGFAVYFAGMTVLVAVSALYLTDDLLNTGGALRLYNSEGMGSGYIAGAEYLPYCADASQFWPRAPYTEGDVSVTDYEKGSLSAEVTCVNSGETEGGVELPLLYYKGYRAYDETGEELPVYCGTNFAVGVRIPAGYEGTWKAVFVNPWYWHVGEAVSVLTFLGLLLEGKLRKRSGRGVA